MSSTTVNPATDYVRRETGIAAPRQDVIRAWLRRAWLNMAEVRMISALSRFTDEQLTQIGIKRSEIPNYARRLIESE